MGQDFSIKPPEMPHRSTGPCSWAGRALLGLVGGVLRFVLALVVDVALVLVRLVLWFRWALLWLGILAILVALANHVMAPAAWQSQLAGGIGGIGLIAISRAALLLDIRLRGWQQRLHHWA